jgi:hypothetical protein
VTKRTEFTDEEWVRIRRAPFVAGMAISLADPGGPIEMSKETIATIKSATNPPSREELLAEVALDIQAMTQQKENPLKGFKLNKETSPGQQVLDELGAAAAMVSAKATADESAGFNQWLLATAQAAADAAKDGGFMGFGAKQVSEGEQTMLDQVKATLGI